MNSCQGRGGREKEHQTVWCCEVQFNNWTKAADKLWQEKLHTPTHTTHTQFQLLKLALNVNWHSEAWGNATLAPAHCWISAQYSPSLALVVTISVTGEVSQRLPIKSVHGWLCYASFQHFEVLLSSCLLPHSSYHGLLYCQPWLIIFSPTTLY